MECVKCVNVCVCVSEALAQLMKTFGLKHFELKLCLR